MYEVVIQTKGQERVIRTGIRRENGAIAERDIAVASEYANKRKRGGRTVRGPIESDPNGEAVVWFDDIATIVTVVTYRKVIHTDDLLDALTASVMALTVGANI